MQLFDCFESTLTVNCFWAVGQKQLSTAFLSFFDYLNPFFIISFIRGLMKKITDVLI